MEYIKTEIEGVFIIEPKVFNDTRGYFMEAWKQAEFNEHVGKVDFIQDNESKSSFGVLRGLHYQKGETSQAKLVRVIKGNAHGFLVLSEEAIFTYKVDNPYSPSTEAGIRWNDPDLGLEWPIDPAKVQTSEKDLKQPFLKDAEVFG